MTGVIWSDRAKDDLWAIGAYWSLHSPARTGEIADRIDEAAAFLSSTPRAGPAVGEDATRKWRIARTDYVITYRVAPDAVEILRVHHVRENWRPEA